MEPTVNVNEVSRISTGTVIKGEITSPNDIRIDGSFEGKIISKGRVVVGEKAVISGDIICENVDFWGKMTGCFYVKDANLLFSGDTIFYCSRGRTDFPGGSEAQLLKSIREKLLVLPDETDVFAGHMEQTTIGNEKRIY